MFDKIYRFLFFNAYGAPNPYYGILVIALVVMMIVAIIRLL